MFTSEAVKAYYYLQQLCQGNPGPPFVILSTGTSHILPTIGKESSEHDNNIPQHVGLPSPSIEFYFLPRDKIHYANKMRLMIIANPVKVESSKIQ